MCNFYEHEVCWGVLTSGSLRNAWSHSTEPPAAALRCVFVCPPPECQAHIRKQQQVRGAGECRLVRWQSKNTLIQSFLLYDGFNLEGKNIRVCPHKCFWTWYWSSFKVLRPWKHQQSRHRFSPAALCWSCSLETDMPGRWANLSFLFLSPVSLPLLQLDGVGLSVKESLSSLVSDCQFFSKGVLENLIVNETNPGFL